METLTQIFKPDKAPTLTVGGNFTCADASPSPPASYCPATNTINVDLAGLQRIGAYADSQSRELLQGDDTAFSVVTSRYMLAVQHQQGLALTGERAALRTACLTGVAQRNMATPVALPSGRTMVLNAGDLDEAISGLLTNHLVASDTNGDSVPAGFTRIAAFRSGLVGDTAQCYGNSREPPTARSGPGREPPPDRPWYSAPQLRRSDRHRATRRRHNAPTRRPHPSRPHPGRRPPVAPRVPRGSPGTFSVQTEPHRHQLRSTLNSDNETQRHGHSAVKDWSPGSSSAPAPWRS